MLSTAPLGKEPRGGDNVRVYIWDRRSNAVRRLSSAGVMVQSRYGSPVDAVDLRGGADRSTVAHRCTGDGVITENAPFLWLDDRQLLVAMLPDGQVSAAIDSYARSARIVTHDASRLHAGIEPTADAVASGAARAALDTGQNGAILRIIDVVTRAARTVAPVPAYPFRGALTAMVSPDATQLAVLATLGALRPQAGREFPNSFDLTWSTERRLGFVGLASPGMIRWAALPDPARYPLELFEWSPDSNSVAFRARADGFTTATPLFVADRADLSVRQLGKASIGGEQANAERVRPAAALWLTAEAILVHSSAGSWRVLRRSGADVPVGLGTGAIPESFVRASDGSVIGIAGQALTRVDTTGRLTPIRSLDRDAWFALPEDNGSPVRSRLLYTHANGEWKLQTIDTVTGLLGPAVPISSADPMTSIS